MIKLPTTLKINSLKNGTKKVLLTAVGAVGVLVITQSVSALAANMSVSQPRPIPPTTVSTQSSSTKTTAAPLAGSFGSVEVGHLEDTQWNLQDSTNGYTEVTVDIKPGVNSFPADQAYFYANTVWFNKYTGTNYGVAYAGLQTNGNDGTKAVGKMLIFSVWDAVSATPVTGGTAVQFGGEGTGYSVRVPYNWQAGTTYRLRMYRLSTVGTNNIWTASVTNLSSKAVQSIGQITVPASYGLIYGPVTFHERYLGNSTACNVVAPSKVDFTNMTANTTLKATAWSHYYMQSPAGCTNYLWLKELANGYRSGVGIRK